MNTTNIMEKRFEKLSDFNLVFISSFEKTMLPEIFEGNYIGKLTEKIKVRKLMTKKLVDNPDVPIKVIESSMQGLDTIPFEGKIYKKGIGQDDVVFFDVYEDLTADIINALNKQEIKSTLIGINSVIGKSVMTKDLLSLPGFNKNVTENDIEVSLELKEEPQAGSKVKTCTLILRLVKDMVPTEIELGKLSYTVFGRR